MCRLISATLLLLVAGLASANEKYPGVGRPATQSELRAWDIDVRAYFLGLPKGSGSVKKGEQAWDAKCASCHGTFGESNAVSLPIVGGTTPADIETGRVAALTRPDQGRTTLMKLSQLSTLWDYINRAMPWDAPKSLSVDEVFAVSAYILNLANIVPDDMVLSDTNIAEVQKRLPNRNGMTRSHGLWDIKGKPDVRNTACMKNCVDQVNVASQLPDSARTMHGDLAEQHRPVGGVRGVRTVPGGAPAGAPPAGAPAK